MAFSLEAVFGVDTSGVRTSIKELRKDLNDFVADYAKLGAGLAVTAFAALSKGALDYAGHLSDMAANLDINVESLQALEAQHKRNGVSQEQLTKALEKTKSSVLAAAEGDEKASAALEKLGLKAADLIKLPLDRQYEKIATAAGEATDQNAAFSAVSALLGEKVGPKLLGSMKELASEGLDAVTASATEAGQVMKAETIAQLDAAGDAIDDFKKRATIAVGEIIVNFRSSEGLQLLGLQFLKVVGEFGAGIVDAIIEAGSMAKAVFVGTFKGVTNFFRDGLIDVLSVVATKFNDILPDFLKERGFTINVAGIEGLKSAGTSIADEITNAIAATEPSTFKKEVGEFWDKRIQDQKLIVDALNEKDFGKEAQALRDAGRNVGESVKKGADAIIDAGEQAGAAIEEGSSSLEDAARSLVQAQVAIEEISRGKSYQTQTTDALQGQLDRLKSKLDEARARDTAAAFHVGGTFRDPAIAQFSNDIAKISAELAQRAEVANYATRFGQQAAVRQYGDEVAQRALQNLSDINVRTANSLDRIQRGLAQNGFIPSL